ncbi:hypothetical protein LOAG_10333 [Loa loa]|uniref:Uncharacterized protein n=1 Tax=Loa loa TaxID=7209 RepID=A0A1S0TPZ8_LOALO|nr:hypothetical protein LOAG_10333 [Loa loa]EFO18163.1 hypothetical protein LOAG_10333 [Loa loa]
MDFTKKRKKEILNDVVEMNRSFLQQTYGSNKQYWRTWRDEHPQYRQLFSGTSQELRTDCVSKVIYQELKAVCVIKVTSSELKTGYIVKNQELIMFSEYFGQNYSPLMELPFTL